jgi:hypothetical protein
LGELIIELAAATKQLSDIKQQLEMSPHADSPEIVALRLEIANFDDDIVTLIPLLSSEKKRTSGPNPPVWSADLVRHADPDLAAIGHVISHLGTATLNTGEEVRNLKLPSIPFFLQRIKMNIPDSGGNPDLRRPREGTSFVDLNIANLRYLNELDLTNASVSDEQIAGFQDVPRLTTLRLDGTNVTDKGLEVLASLGSLRELSLLGTNVTPKGVRRLRQALPNCRITAPTTEEK